VSARRYHEGAVARVLEHLWSRLDEPVDFGVLVGLTGISEFSLHRLFRALVGESIEAHVRRLRVESAAIRLRSSRSSVLEVALDSGYESHEGFTRAFTRHFGVPPSRYRREHGLSATDASPLRWTPRRAAFSELVYADHLGPYAEVGKAFATLFSGASAVLREAPRAILGLSYDDPAVSPAGRLRYRAAMQLASPVPGALPPSLGRCSLPERLYAVTRFVGPASSLARTYDALVSAVVLSDTPYRLGLAPAVEVYVRDARVSGPEALELDLMLPLEEDGA
jgi:AraC family transcriptional regulator